MSDNEQSQPAKRRKTARACDYCRDHKLKCDFSCDKVGTSSLKCKHCKDFGIECIVSARVAPQRTSAASSTSSATKDAYLYRRVEMVSQTEPRYAGPTSLSQLVSAVTKKWPSRANQMMSQMDSQYGHARVEGVSGGPFLMLPQVRYPPEQPDRPDFEGARIDSATKRFLLSKYQRFLARIFPILSDKESTDAVELGQDNQTIATLSNVGLALLSIAAMIRDTPAKTRMALLYHLRRRRHVDISSSLETVQYLLLLCANVEILSPDTNISTGMSLNLTGLLVRMAQDLGLHRDISSLKVSKEHLNRRARIWAACVIVDRWYSISYGQPVLIRREDCDAPPPSPFLDGEGEIRQSCNDRVYDVHVEHTKLSILIGRILRMVFTPSGMQNITMEEMEVLKRDLDAWDTNLPSSLRTARQGKESHDINIGAGLLQILKVAVDFIFYRAALVSPYNTSKNSIMAPLPVWESIVKRSAEAIDWISTTEGTSVLDAWSIVMYGMIQCCLVQFYAAVNGEDPEPLRQARRCLHSWGCSTEAQSHGYYEPIEGNTTLSSHNTTSADSVDLSSLGRKSLTLRTKAHTVVAMLAGIAEHHIANRSKPEVRAESSKKRNSTSLPKTVPMPSQSSTKVESTSLPVAPPSSSSTLSPYQFEAVLNPPNGPIPSMQNNKPIYNHSIPTALHQYSTPLIPSSNMQIAPPVFPSNTHQLFPPPRNSLSQGHHHHHHQHQDLYNVGIEEVDLLTLQHWADEVLMRNPPNLDILSYSQQQQLQPQLDQKQQQQHDSFL